MTPDKYTPFESRVEAMLGGIHKNVVEIKRVVGGLYQRLSDLQKSTDAVYDAVSYETQNNAESSSYEDNLCEDDD